MEFVFTLMLFIIAVSLLAIALILSDIANLYREQNRILKGEDTDDKEDDED